MAGVGAQPPPPCELAVLVLNSACLPRSAARRLLAGRRDHRQHCHARSVAAGQPVSASASARLSYARPRPSSDHYSRDACYGRLIHDSRHNATAVVGARGSLSSRVSSARRPRIVRARALARCDQLWAGAMPPETRFEQCPGNRKRLLPSRFLSLAGSCPPTTDEQVLDVYSVYTSSCTCDLFFLCR